jgi:hypothetical protein
MTGIEVLVRLAAADPWSFTVFDTLTRKIGYSEIVGVTRIRSWRLEFDLPAESALAATRQLLKETALLANPNRDLWCVREVAESAGRQDIWRMQEGARDAHVVVVTDTGDPVGGAMLRVLKTRLRLKGIEAVRFSWLWVLETGVGDPRSEVIAADSAVSRSWRRGLLSNPHYQTANTIRAEVYLPHGEVRP